MFPTKEMRPTFRMSKFQGQAGRLPYFGQILVQGMGAR